MKTLFLVANWKSFKTREETLAWFEIFSSHTESFVQTPEKRIVVCLPYVYLPRARQSQQEKHLPLFLGAQDVSPFGQGAYTGEVHAKQIKEYADYVIIGHSERRQHFGENDDMLGKKVSMAVTEGLTPIFCVQGKDTPIPAGVTIVAYEPVFAIGSGTPDTPESAQTVAKAIKEAHSTVQAVLYGGSVKPDNVSSFTAQESIDGVLVGGASLDPETFTQLVHNA